MYIYIYIYIFMYTHMTIAIIVRAVVKISIIVIIIIQGAAGGRGVDRGAAGPVFCQLSVTSYCSSVISYQLLV